MSIALIQISDLHFAHEFFPKGHRSTVPANPKAPPLLKVQGLAAHDVAACEDLDNALSDVFAGWAQGGAGANPSKNCMPLLKILTITGDLTVCGDDSEFALALTFVRGIVADEWSSGFGLGKVSFDDVLAVPGNHDHWGGAYKFLLQVTPPNIHGAYFPCAPGARWWFREYAPSTGPVLQLLGLDTCGGAGARLLAKGSVDPGDLRGLGTSISQSNARHRRRQIVRVLLAHHGFSMPPGAKGWAHALDSASEQALRKFLTTQQIHRVLTGHVHTPHLPTTAVGSVAEEIRCGTTLQAYPKAGQTFLLHTIEEAGGHGYFETVPYQRTRAGGFQASRASVRAQLY